MQFDFNLAANQNQHIDVSGTFFKYKSGAGPIRVRLDGGGYLDLVPGQGVRNVNFSSVDVKDRSGAANTGTILAGNYDFEDDNVTIGGGSLNIGNDTAHRVPIQFDPTAILLTAQPTVNYNNAWSDGNPPASTAAINVLTVLTPAQNPNGLYVELAEFAIAANGSAVVPVAHTLIAKAGAAPTSETDGDVIMVTVLGGNDAGSGPVPSANDRLPYRVKIAAGKGLYVVAGFNGVQNIAHARKTILTTIL